MVCVEFCVGFLVSLGMTFDELQYLAALYKVHDQKESIIALECVFQFHDKRMVDLDLDIPFMLDL